MEFLYKGNLKVENGTLSFSPTSKEDEGRYSCEIENGAGERLKKVIVLKVHGRKNYSHSL